jgi:hypothetical protein
VAKPEPIPGTKTAPGNVSRAPNSSLPVFNVTPRRPGRATRYQITSKS